MRVERRSDDPGVAARSLRDEPPALPETDPDDRELTLAFQRGEKGAYQAIYEKHSARVFRICGRVLNQPEDAQEAAQETFVRVYQALGRFNGRYQLGAWIARIATNVCLDQLRSISRRPVDIAPLEAIDARMAEKNPRNDPEALLVRGQESHDVRLMLESLPPLHRAAIVLRDIEGFSYEEIAAALDMSQSQVKALLHRARAGFKRSWLSRALSALLPARLLQRARLPEHLTPGNEHVVQTVSGSINAAASCGATLAQCGQYVSERAAAGIAALVVSSAAVAGAGVANTSPAPLPTPSALAAVAESAERPSDRSETKEIADRQVESEEPFTDVSADSPPAPDPDTTPTPQPSATATAAPSDEGDPKDHEEPPTGFFPVVGFDWGAPVSARIPKSHEAAVSCKEPVVAQRLETVIQDARGVARPARLVLSIGTTDDQLGMVSFELTVDPGENEIYYSGSGGLSEDSGADKTRDLKYTGDYGSSNQQAGATDLPQSGDFSVSLGLDCAAQSVVTESVILATD